MIPAEFAKKVKAEYAGIEIGLLMYEIQHAEKLIRESSDPRFPLSLRVKLSRYSMHELMNMLIERQHVLTQTGSKEQTGECNMAAKKKHVEEAPAKPTKKSPVGKAEVPAKPEKAAKAPKEAGESAPRGRASKYAPTDKITLLRTDNPKREGTESYERYSLYRNNMTVGKFIELGGKLADIAYDTRRGFISLD